MRRPDGKTPPLSVELDLDGRRVTCLAPMARTAGGRTCDDVNVRVEHRELSDCTETRSGTLVSQICVPNGKLEQEITIVGTPKRVGATLTADGTVAGQEKLRHGVHDGLPQRPGLRSRLQAALGGLGASLSAIG